MVKPDLPDTWTVTVTSAAGDLRAEPVDAGAVQSVVELLPADHGAAVSHKPRDWSVRLTIWEYDAIAAASEAVEVVRGVREKAGLPDWSVSHLEITRGAR